jgi:hypothetical protein
MQNLKEPRITAQEFAERQFHRVVVERDRLRAWCYLWFVLSLTAWGALIAAAVKAGILPV